MALEATLSQVAGRLRLLPSLEGKDALALASAYEAAAKKDELLSAAGARQARAEALAAVGLAAPRVAIAIRSAVRGDPTAQPPREPAPPGSVAPLAADGDPRVPIRAAGRREVRVTAGGAKVSLDVVETTEGEERRTSSRAVAVL